MNPAPAIVIQADRFELLRCRCPVCLLLDARYPAEGFQLALFPYRPARRERAR
ncbi:MULTISPECIES: hypothetical protein [unclassified Sphingomonas]|uniref:hypothetical protein n=1 Tax=unclassified Sphingomonas TaxID=196159 RepID=UPI000AA2A9CC|nr:MULTISPECIES: hypothetical protein [unclassified Sphingomonas]